jgi:hypothetical protein
MFGEIMNMRTSLVRPIAVCSFGAGRSGFVNRSVPVSDNPEIADMFYGETDARDEHVRVRSDIRDLSPRTRSALMVAVHAALC